jgi:hypothetical protein
LRDTARRANLRKDGERNRNHQRENQSELADFRNHYTNARIRRAERRPAAGSLLAQRLGGFVGRVFNLVHVLGFVERLRGFGWHIVLVMLRHDLIGIEHAI